MLDVGDESSHAQTEGSRSRCVDFASVGREESSHELRWYPTQASTCASKDAQFVLSSSDDLLSSTISQAERSVTIPRSKHRPRFLQYQIRQCTRKPSCNHKACIYSPCVNHQTRYRDFSGRGSWRQMDRVSLCMPVLNPTHIHYRPSSFHFPHFALLVLSIYLFSVVVISHCEDITPPA